MMERAKISVHKISKSKWDFHSTSEFYKGHGLQDVVDLSICQLAPAGNLFADFFKVEINTREGLTGFYGPVEPEIALDILNLSKLKVLDLLIESFFDSPDSWIFPSSVNARTRGILDCALWDLRGKQLGEAVGTITAVGAPSDRLACYASLITVDVDGPNTSSIARRIQGLNFWGQKWSLPDGPESGTQGLTRNLKRIEKVRKAVGESGRIMIEAHSRWTPEYLDQFLKFAKDYNLSWIEDPLPFHKNAYLEIGDGWPPICVGETFDEVATFESFIDKQANFIIQVDVVSCGGYTNARVIKEQCIKQNRLLVLHGRRLVPSLHLAASSPSGFRMILEFNPIFEPERQTLIGVKSKLVPSENDGAIRFHLLTSEGLWEAK